MKKLMLTAIAVIFMVCLSSVSFAATKDVTYTIPPVAVLALGDPNQPLTLIAPPAGSGQFGQVNCTITMSVSVNNLSSAKKKITLSTPAVDGLHWSADAPGYDGIIQHFTPYSERAIDGGPVDFITDLYQDAGVLYSAIRVYGDMTASVVTNATATMTFTLTNQ